MQKKILAAVIGGILMSTNTVLLAADLDLDGAVVPTNFISSGADGTTTVQGLDTNCELDLTTVPGVALAAGSNYIRIDFTNTEIGTALVAGTHFTVGATPGIVVSGGGVGDGFVVVKAGAGVADAALAIDAAVIFLGDAAPLLVFDDGATSASVQVRTYDEANDALNPDTANESPVADTGVVEFVTFAEGFDIAVAALAPAEIDVTNKSDFSAGGSGPVAVGTVVAQVTEGICNANNAAPAAVANGEDIWDTTELVVTATDPAFGDMTVDLFTNAACSAVTPATALGTTGTAMDATAGTATFSDATSNDLVAGTTGTAAYPALYYICISGDGTDDIPVTSLNCELSLLTDIGSTSGACGSTAYSGSSDRVNYGLTPGGKYKQYFRISNPSATSGEVTVTLVNDAGDPASFLLSAITGNAELAAGASTGPMSIDSLYANAKVVTPDFDHNGGKLRVIVRGEFGDDLDNGAAQVFGDANSTDGIVIEAASVMKDGEGFGLME